jgi:hypothetical protein
MQQFFVFHVNKLFMFWMGVMNQDMNVMHKIYIVVWPHTTVSYRAFFVPFQIEKSASTCRCYCFVRNRHHLVILLLHIVHHVSARMLFPH